jgi:hypothetical protein
LSSVSSILASQDWLSWAGVRTVGRSQIVVDGKRYAIASATTGGKVLIHQPQTADGKGG